jgi:hypothetical protein
MAERPNPSLSANKNISKNVDLFEMALSSG